MKHGCLAVLSIAFFAKSLIVASFKLRLWRRVPLLEKRAAASHVTILGTFFVVFLGEAGFFVLLVATTVFISVVLLFDATTFFVGIIVTMAGCLVDVDVFAALFLVGVKQQLSSSWE